MHVRPHEPAASSHASSNFDDAGIIWAVVYRNDRGSVDGNAIGNYAAAMGQRAVSSSINRAFLARKGDDSLVAHTSR